MIKEDVNSKNIDDFDELKANSDYNLENMLEEFSSINSELIRINRQLEDISENLREKSDGITIGHFSIGIFCICLAIIFF
tara:strand:+ start:881 stop:1120 length:240 start_codon:yes stop_codon:yes gene_type:complete